MRKWAALFAAMAIAIGVWLFLSNHRAGPAETSPEKNEQQNAAVTAALSNQPARTVSIIESNFARVKPVQGNVGSAVAVSVPLAGPAAPLEFTNFPAETAVENMSRAIHQYGEMFGGNPIGTNPEFARQLGGDNPKHINFISADAGMRVNGDGELVDPWGTPYFFHQLSGSDTEVRSAGPDRIMWTSDDIVVH
jgi:hypothetical protein